MVRMVIPLFILGRPGSGKTTVARWIQQRIGNSRLVLYEDDYKILYHMYEQDTQQIRFECVAHGGFDIKDPAVLDKALALLKSRALRPTRSLDAERLVIIQFARSNYARALDFFGTSFLQRSYFVFLTADIEECIQRVRARVNDKAPDGHFVSEAAMRRYYSFDDILSLPRYLHKQHRVELYRMRTIDTSNKGGFSTSELSEETQRFVRFILDNEKLPTTEQLPIVIPHQASYEQETEPMSKIEVHIDASSD